MKFPAHRVRRSHTGFSVPTDQPASSAAGVALHLIDEASADRFAGAEGLRRRDRRAIVALGRISAEQFVPGYIVTGSDGTPLVGALRIPGGPKTSATMRSNWGRAVPFVGEREHLLAGLWVAPAASVEQLALAIRAIAFADPPANLSRTVMLLSEGAEPSIRTALTTAGFSPYLHCIAQFSWKVPWKRRIDWIGPPPPARSVISSATAQVAAPGAPIGIETAPNPGNTRSVTALTQEVSP